MSWFKHEMEEAGITNFEDVEVEAVFTPSKLESKSIFGTVFVLFEGQLFSKRVSMEFFEKWEIS